MTAEDRGCAKQTEEQVNTKGTLEVFEASLSIHTVDSTQERDKNTTKHHKPRGQLFPTGFLFCTFHAAVFF